MTTTWWGITILCVVCVAVWIALSALLYRQFFKRFYDIVLSFIAIIVFSPLLIVLMTVGAIAMKGNPFFVQKRPGKHEKIFSLLKFRSMSNKKDRYGNLLPDEERLGKYGKFLRVSSLDELPSLFNIFIGNMSIIGPRPLATQYLPYYNDEEKHRHDVRPGLTGLAQVNGRTAIEWKKRFDYDIRYIQHISLLNDLKILFLTIAEIFKKTDVVDASDQGDFYDYREKQFAEHTETKRSDLKIAIIGGGLLASVFAKKARENGIAAYCFSPIDGVMNKDDFDKVFDIDIFKFKKIIKICKKLNIGGFIATTELTVYVAAYLAKKTCKVGNSPDVAAKITDKYWVREKTHDCINILQPYYFYCNDINELKSKICEYPVIIKPIQEGGKRGVIVVNDESELGNAYAYAHGGDKKKKGLIVEQFLGGGSEYSVEGLSCNGLHNIVQITKKISSGPPHCVELGHSQPADLDDEERESVCKAVDELLTTVNVITGPSHTEIKIIDDKVYLIELNCRPGGDHIAYPLTELSTGYDYMAQIVNVALGFVPSPIDRSYKRYAGVRFIAKQTDELKQIFDGCDNADWLYEKHVESDELKEMDHNDASHNNYFIYCAPYKPEFLDNKNG